MLFAYFLRRRRRKKEKKKTVRCHVYFSLLFAGGFKNI
jgi:hypothetical protein